MLMKNRTPREAILTAVLAPLGVTGGDGIGLVLIEVFHPEDLPDRVDVSEDRMREAFASFEYNDDNLSPFSEDELTAIMKSPSLRDLVVVVYQQTTDPFNLLEEFTNRLIDQGINFFPNEVYLELAESYPVLEIQDERDLTLYLSSHDKEPAGLVPVSEDRMREVLISQYTGLDVDGDEPDKTLWLYFTEEEAFNIMRSPSQRDTYWRLVNLVDSVQQQMEIDDFS